MPASFVNHPYVTIFIFSFTVFVLLEDSRFIFLFCFFHLCQLLRFSHDESPRALPFPERGEQTPIGQWVLEFPPHNNNVSICLIGGI